MQPLLARFVPAGSPAGTKTHAGVRGEATAIQRRPAAQVAKDIALFLAAPFVTLVYVSLFPIIGMALLVQAWRRRKQAG
jgi:hypothetical protein